MTNLLLFCVGAACLADALWWHRRFRQSIDRQRTRNVAPTRLRWPSVTVIRPVRGRDAGAEENLRSALDTGYPGEVDTVFVLDDTADPAWPLVRDAVEEHRLAGRPGRAEILIAGAPPEGRTGKLNAMIVGLQRARGELVAFADSDVRADPQALQAIVECLLTTPGAGDAFAPVVVAPPPRNAGDAGYALLLNALYGPAVARAQILNGGDLPFIMGQFMVFHRSTLEAIGGLECADGHLVDDMWIGRCVAEAGLRNVMAPHPVAITQSGMPPGEFLPLLKRWLLFSRGGLTFGFTWPLWLRGLNFWVSLSAAVAGLVAGKPMALLPAASVAVLGTSLELLHRRFGGGEIRPGLRLVPFLIFLGAPWVYFSTLTDRRVTWRGREYALDSRARLAAPAARRKKPRAA